MRNYHLILISYVNIHRNKKEMLKTFNKMSWECVQPPRTSIIWYYVTVDNMRDACCTIHNVQCTNDDHVYVNYFHLPYYDNGEYAY